MRNATVKLHTKIYGWKHVWLEFADEFRADVEDSDPNSSHTKLSLTLPIQDTAWSLIYTMHPAGTGKHDHTTVETSYTPHSDFKFAIHPQSWFDGFGKLLGMQDIIVGHPDFDKAFVIKGSNEALVKDFFQDAAVRNFLLNEPHVQMWADCHHEEHAPAAKVLHSGGGNNRLAMRLKGAVDDFEKLKTFYKVKHRSLENLVKIGAAAN